MDVINKLKALSRSTADATADIGLINQYSKKELAPDEVYAYSLILCDNDEDRDGERFTNKALNALAPMFLGKTGIFDHWRSAEKQHSRIYRTSVEKAGEMNSLGEPLYTLRADAYMLRTDDTKPIIDAIEGGILKEVSVSCKVKECNCSICKKPLKFHWTTWTYQCETGHIKGQSYDGKKCVGELEKPQDAFEFSFVAVPAQHAAGVIKGIENTCELIKQLTQAKDLPSYPNELKALMHAAQMAMNNAAEREERAKIAAAARERLKIDN